MDMNIKWGVIGCGGIADRRTIPGMMKADNAELIAVMDTNPEAAARVGQKYGVGYVFQNADDLLALNQVEAVYIATPVFCHKDQVIAAAKAKKHILLEKPVGLTTEEAEEMAAVCESEGVKLGVGFMMRFHGCHQKMKELITEGKLGEIVSAHAQFTCWYPEMEHCWRQDKNLSGGGAMMDMGIHCVDLMRCVTGLNAVEVTGIAGNQVFRYGVEDAGTVLFRMENGAICCVESNFNIPDAAARCRFELYGTKGSIMAEGTISQTDSGRMEVLCADDSLGYDAAQDRGELKPLNVTAQTGDLYQQEIEAFGNAVINGTEPPVSARDGIQSQRIIEAAYQSSQQKRSILLTQ